MKSFAVILIFSSLSFTLSSCEKRSHSAPSQASQIDEAAQALQSSVPYIQEDGLEKVKRMQDPAKLAQYKERILEISHSPHQTLATTKAGTVLYQKYGHVDPRHAMSYLYLLRDDATMENALLKAAEMDKLTTLAALDTRITKVTEIVGKIQKPVEQKRGRQALSQLQKLKKQIESR